jgi:hypothetical protein
MRESAKGQVRLEPIRISAAILSVKQEERFPLIDRAEFTVDTKASEVLLRKICWIAVETNEVLADAGTKVIDALDKKTAIGWSRSRPCTSICWPRSKALKAVLPYGPKCRSIQPRDHLP